MHYDHPSEIMDEIARLTPTFAGVSYEKLDAAGLGAVAVQRQGAGRHADHAYRQLRARQGQFHHHRICADRREDRPALPAAAHHRPHPQPVQCRRADAAHRERRLARGGPAGNPSARRRAARRARRRLGAARTAAPGETSLRARDHRPRGAGRRLHHLPPPGHAGQRRHHRLFRLGDQLPRIQGDGGAGVAVQRPDANGRTEYRGSGPARAGASSRSATMPAE